MLIFKFIILFSVTTTTGLLALMLKKHIYFLILPINISPLCLKRSFLVPVSLRPPPS